MASYMRLCEDCDRLQSYPQTCYDLLMEGYDGVFGHLIEPTVKRFSWNDDWEVNHEHKTVKLLKTTLEARRDAIDRLLTHRNLERSASGLFGIVTYGVQLITYREDEDGLFIWAARRSPTKTLYPNRLGVTVGGSLPAGETPYECLIREAHEEAGLESQLVKSHAKSAGTISYVTSSETKTTSGGEPGLIRAEIQYIYDMKVGKDVIPTPHDMEASSINLYSVNEIKKALDDGDFTPANACLILDFFIRHGLVTFENEPRYNEIISRLHRPLGTHAA
ncbi:thiamine pyrophosphokinase-related protein [Diaporthe sp. PMI_573]|nr:thiamine pyrophosphokinase-related protein [Diaporthaceae sp. PMI_573]